MSSLARQLCAGMLVVPLAALADPVEVHSWASGTIDSDPVVLSQLDIELDDYPEQLPFSLSVRSLWDRDGGGAIFDYGQRVEGYGVPVSISLSIGGQTYEFADASGAGYLATSPSGYLQDVSFEYGRYDISISISGRETVGLTGSPLAPRPATPGDGLAGLVEIRTYPTNPDAPGSWIMWSTTVSTWVQVSPVPEPATNMMLLAGLGALLCWQGRRRLRTAGRTTGRARPR